MQNEESVTPASAPLQENLQNLFGALSFFSLILLVIVLPFASILLLFFAVTAFLNGTFALGELAAVYPLPIGGFMLLLAVFLHVRSPRLYAWIILRSMRDKADLQNSHAADMPQSREAPVNTLEIAEYDEEAVALTDRYQEFEILQVLQGNSSRVFATGTLCSLFVSAIVIVVFASATQSLDIDHLLAILTPFGPQLLVVVMKLVSDSDLKNWQALLLGVISHAGILLPVYEEPLIPQSTALIFLGLHLFMIGLSSFVARFSTQLKLRNAGIAAPNLLLLRVFGVDRNSHGAFRTFANKWTNLGPMLTIVDGSCAAFDFRSRVNQLLPVSILPFLLFLLLVISDGIAVIMVVITVAAVFHICLLCIYFLVVWRRSTGNFARNRAAIEMNIAAQQERGMFIKYPQGRLYCFDDTWRMAVHRLVEWAHFILMDLRGVQADNHGCAYEIEYLLNHVKLDHCVFLLDDSTDKVYAESLIRGIWQRGLTIESPNREGKAVVHLYRAENFGNSAADMQGLLALLAELLALESKPTSGQLSRQAKVMAMLEGLNLTGWALVLVSFIVGTRLEAPQSSIISGPSVFWIAIIWLLLARRVKLLYSTQGNAKGLFAARGWSFVFSVVTASWLYWFLVIPLMN